MMSCLSSFWSGFALWLFFQGVEGFFDEFGGFFEFVFLAEFEEFFEAFDGVGLGGPADFSQAFRAEVEGIAVGFG